MKRTSALLAALALCGSAAAQIGIIDTVGGTIYDWQYGWCAYRYIAHAPGYGIHATWMWSNDTVGNQADRNFRYNFYDFATRRWAWIDPDFMLSGTNVFDQRSGFGNIDADPVTGAALISCHQGSAPIHPNLARDIEPGAGDFRYCVGSPVLDGYLWPLMAVGQNQTVHFACVDDATRDNHWYARMTTWCSWDSPWQITPTPPTFPSHNITASKVSNKVCQMWIKADAFPYVGYYRISPDGGTNWDSIVDLGYPPAFGPDTGCSYYITSSMPFYDRHDQLHIVVDVMPIIRDTVFAAPIELWHWCETNNPVWKRVHRADADPHYSGSTGTNALYACRPSIGEDSRGNLFVSWEQFDSTNVDPSTHLMRADVWLAGSSDNGQSWYPGMMITRQGPVSHRFPCMIDLAIPGGQDPDTVVVLYLDDSIAGPKAGSSPVGAWSRNPYIAQKVPADAILTGVAEGANRPGEVRKQTLEVRVQNPVRGRAEIRYSLPVAGDVSLAVLDAAGRTLATLVSEYRAPGIYRAGWDAPMPGVYFVSLTAGGKHASAKLVVTR